MISQNKHLGPPLRSPKTLNGALIFNICWSVIVRESCKLFGVMYIQVRIAFSNVLHLDFETTSFCEM